MANKKKPLPSRMERSTFEAYAGLTVAILTVVLPMSWQLRAALWATLCLIYGDFAWRSLVTSEWRRFWKVILTAVVVGLIGWAGWTNVQHQIREEDLPPITSFVLTTGPVNEVRNLTTLIPRSPSDPVIVQSGVAANFLIANGDALIKTRYAARKYRLVAISFFYDGLIDARDVKDLSKSGAFDISKGEITLRIPWTDQYLRRFLRGDRGTNYYLLLVPKNLSPSDFDTIRQATEKGAIVLQHTSGTP